MMMILQRFREKRGELTQKSGYRIFGFGSIY